MVKPVSPQGLRFLELILNVSSEGPFTSPTGNLKPSVERNVKSLASDVTFNIKEVWNYQDNSLVNNDSLTCLYSVHHYWWKRQVSHQR